MRDIDQLHRRGVWGRCFRWVLLLAALVGVMAAGLPQAQAAAPGQTGQVRTVVPLGQAVGIKLFAQGVLVVGLSDITTQEGPVSPARACGLQAGDVITHINDDPVNSIEQVQTVLQDLEGDEMELTVLRDETSRDMTTRAVQCSADGAYKLGAWIRDSMAGIGTLTFYEPGDRPLRHPGPWHQRRGHRRSHEAPARGHHARLHRRGGQGRGRSAR